jgi:Na+/H+-translocating membrane pyrophosphatase
LGAGFVQAALRAGEGLLAKGEEAAPDVVGKIEERIAAW